MATKVIIDGKSYVCEQGENLAALLFRENLVPLRKHPVDNSKRAPFCMMGVCFECLVEMDGIPSVQSCLVSVADGMVINRGLND